MGHLVRIKPTNDGPIIQLASLIFFFFFFFFFFCIALLFFNPQTILVKNLYHLLMPVRIV